MKRLITASVIIAVIITLGVLTIVMIANENANLLGEITSVINGYKNDEDITEDISSLQQTMKKYKNRVGVVSNDEVLARLDEAVVRLKAMYESGSDEFLAECYSVKAIADEILQQQKPTLARLL